MTEWVSCPKCGALMIGLTGGHICPLCGYKLPVQTITYTTGTEPYKDWIVRYYGSHNDIPPGHTDGELTELIRCKDCKHHQGYNCDRLYGFQDVFTFMDEDYCSKAERRE